jgi:hypothetical protein
LKLAATITRSLQAGMQAELRDVETAVATGTREAGRGLKSELRREVASAGLGQRLANSWRDKHYPNQRLDAASLVYTKVPQIIRAFDEGAVIRSTRVRFLAIPTENAPRKGTDGKRISPSTAERTLAAWWWTDCALRSAERPGICGTFLRATDRGPSTERRSNDGCDGSEQGLIDDPVAGRRLPVGGLAIYEQMRVGPSQSAHPENSGQVLQPDAQGFVPHREEGYTRPGVHAHQDA